MKSLRREGHYIGQCPRSGAGIAGALLGRHDPSVCNQDHVLSTELLLQLSNKPLLDLVEALLQSVGHLSSHAEIRPMNTLSGITVGLLCLSILPYLAF